MSNVLIIRHLPSALSLHDKEKLLKHFGADKVWETSSKRNYIFASFGNVDQARSALSRLHQLEIAQRRLVVEYSLQKEPESSSHNEINISDKQSSDAAKHIQSFLRSLNSWNPSLNFYQPPPIHVKYKYPEISPTVIINIIYSMLKHKPLYVQTLHLMNKMSLDTPFIESEEAMTHFKDLFRQYFIEEISSIPLPVDVSEVESEISSDEEDKLNKPMLPTVVRRTHTLAKTRKRAAAVLATANLPKAKRKAQDNVDVFDKPQLQEQKKISLVVSQDALEKQTETVEVVGELGKFEIEKEPDIVEEIIPEIEKPAITKRELVHNRVSYSDMKLLPVFKNYHPGQKSMRLYIKNLGKHVTEQDVKRIYKRYVEDLSENEQIGFDVRVMQEGRMKGQAFVTFPSEKIAEQALTETNGFILNGKPMVVQFARAATANKKPIE